MHDSRVMDDLLHGEETSVYGDKAYADEAKRMEYKAPGVEWYINRKGTRDHPLSEEEQDWAHTQN